MLQTGLGGAGIAGNLLTTILPAGINGGVSITPQGIVFDDQGNFRGLLWQ